MAKDDSGLSAVFQTVAHNVDTASNCGQSLPRTLPENYPKPLMWSQGVEGIEVLFNRRNFLRYPCQKNLAAQVDRAAC